MSNIDKHIRKMYDFEVSASTISRVTGCCIKRGNRLAVRPLDDLYLIMWMGGIVLKVRENYKVIIKAIYLAVGLNRDGRKEVLGILKYLDITRPLLVIS